MSAGSTGNRQWVPSRQQRPVRLLLGCPNGSDRQTLGLIIDAGRALCAMRYDSALEALDRAAEQIRTRS